jgi:hypothetical protein
MEDDLSVWRLPHPHSLVFEHDSIFCQLERHKNDTVHPCGATTNEKYNVVFRQKRERK